MPEQDDAQVRESVILVHGTAAASADDVGPGWWQRCDEADSFCATFSSRLARSRAELSQEPFHWSGANRESDRRSAGRSLLAERLLPLEEQRRPYHLIGHSHGGSVIWHAIQTAVENGIELNYLKSWSTVGTPFIHYKGRIDWLTIFLSVPAMPVYVLAWLCGFLLLFYLPFVAIAQFEGKDLSVLWWYWSEGVPGMLFDKSVAGMLLGLGGFVLLFFIGALLLQPFRFYRQAGKLRQQVMARYGGRWFTLWSKNDEAINALAVTPRVCRSSQAVAPRYSQRLSRDESEVLAKIAQASPDPKAPARSRLSSLRQAKSQRLIGAPMNWVINSFWWLMKKAHDSVIARMVDRIVWSSVAHASQGNDLSAHEAALAGEISPCPLPGEEHRQHCVSLPEWLEEDLLARTKLPIEKMVGELRSVLGQVALAGEIPTLLTQLKDKLTWEEIVHTTYFRCEHCRELLALHVEMSSDFPQSLLGETDSAALKSWLQEWKERARTLISGLKVTHD